MESVGFKEWSLVCHALGRGEQSIILRKGGIAEGREGFSFRHREFFLFPTFFHEQAAKVRIASANLPEAGDTVTIRWYAKAERALRIDSLRIAEALSPLHILTPEVVRERFGYKDQGIHVAFLRVFEVSPSWILQNEKRFAGCRSWVDLPSRPEMKMRPVVDDVAHQRVRAEFDRLTGSSLTPDS
ncbi:MAG: hypothetical protein DME38_14770 [Verrucomicrobia bacterium]|nr:MAG: hypothetical protein DME38_14770 [Verrucomicrobiota bacterium]